MTTRLLIGIVALLTCKAELAEAQSLPGTNLTVTARIRAVMMSKDTTVISYSLLSDPGSLERLVSFKVNLTMTPTVVVVPTPDSEWVVRKLFSGLTGASWVALAGIGAGDSTPTLTFKAIGLPGIVKAWYHGDSLPTYDEDDSAAVANAPQLDPYADLSKTIQTVGAETAPTTLSALITRLKTLTDSSCTLRWITSGGLCTGLDTHLTASPSQVLRYSSSLDSARTGGSAVTDPAYLMLHANVGYIESFIDVSAITLRYVCGNKFRIRNGNYATFPGVYHLNTLGQTAHNVTAQGRSTDSPGYTDTILEFTTQVANTFILAYNGVTLATVSNGHTTC